METIDYRTMAEEWLEHVVQQYDAIHVCRKDLLLIEYMLRKGFTVVAVRDGARVLRVDFKACSGERTACHSRER